MKLGGGDLSSAVAALVQSGDAGAVLSIEVDKRSLGLQREREEELLQRAWQIAIDLLPRDAVGRRAAWSRFEFALEGTRDACGTLGRHLLSALGNHLPRWTWRIVFIEIFVEEPLRTFLCDPGYELAAAQGNVIVWVEPYSGSDWRESQRYPTVTFLVGA